MPGEYPDYPNHAQALEYLRSFAKVFGLYEFIRFGQAVERAERVEEGDWRVTLGDGETRTYSGIIVAAGIHWTPNLPELPGEFDGECIHSSRYKSPDILRDKRVLIVGAGNSGCDIAVEAAQHAARTFLSVRRGYHYLPKYVFGRPTDQVGEIGVKLHLPLFIRRPLDRLLLKVVVGSPEQYGLPKPDHKLLESHPIVNSQILLALGQGDITPSPTSRSSGAARSCSRMGPPSRSTSWSTPPAIGLLPFPPPSASEHHRRSTRFLPSRLPPHVRESFHPGDAPARQRGLAAHGSPGQGRSAVHPGGRSEYRRAPEGPCPEAGVTSRPGRRHPVRGDGSPSVGGRTLQLPATPQGTDPAAGLLSAPSGTTPA